MKKQWFCLIIFISLVSYVLMYLDYLSTYLIDVMVIPFYNKYRGISNSSHILSKNKNKIGCSIPRIKNTYVCKSYHFLVDRIAKSGKSYMCPSNNGDMIQSLYEIICIYGIVILF